MQATFKRSLLGYNRKQVDDYLTNLKPDPSLTKRLQELMEENGRITVELKIARSGFIDAAELMQAAQAKARGLEEEMQKAEARMQELEEKLRTQAATDMELLQKIEAYKQQMETLKADSTAEAERLEDEIGRFENTYLKDGTVVEKLTFSPPAGMEDLLEHETKGDAQTLMQRIYKIRMAEEKE